MPSAPSPASTEGRTACIASREGRRSGPVTLGAAAAPVTGLLRAEPSVFIASSSWPAFGSGGEPTRTGPCSAFCAAQAESAPASASTVLFMGGTP
jgi:hypothetical protein